MQKQSDHSSLGTNIPRIGIDLLGSDTPSHLLLASVIAVSKQLSSSAQFVLFHKEAIQEHLPSNLSTVIVQDVITMDDDPLLAIRRKKNSSICEGMKMLKEKKLDAFISAGNTGALMASAKTTLEMLHGIERPALLTLLPTKQKEVAVLDVGANITYNTSHLLQFAAMGIAYQKSRGIAEPKVGLLNIGTEAKKGTPELQQAYAELLKWNDSASYPIFQGNIEGRDVFQGNIDVVVTDGFTGNVLLKTAEGIAAFLLDQLQEYALEVKETSSPFQQVLQRFRHRLDYSEYPGALLCGIDGIVIKCHGDSQPQAMHHSIIEAAHLIQNSFLEKIKSQLSL